MRLHSTPGVRYVYITDVTGQTPVTGTLARDLMLSIPGGV